MSLRLCYHTILLSFALSTTDLVSKQLRIKLSLAIPKLSEYRRCPIIQMYLGKIEVGKMAKKATETVN